MRAGDLWLASSQRGGSLKCTSRPALLGGQMTTIRGEIDPLDGLSQSALKSEAHWWHGRALELEIKNEKLQKLVWDMWLDLDVPQLDSDEYRRRMHELGLKWPDECSES